DARIDVVVDSPTGGVTTYASVPDNKTNDPLAVSPTQTDTLSANRYVLPGMADFASAISNFHSDIGIYNASQSFVNATATYYPAGNGTPIVRNVGINVGEIKVYNNVLPTLFGIAPGTGNGSIVITTPTNITHTPNEFRQLGSILSSLNAGNTYNARIIMRVTSGSGRVTAYGSVVDNLTSDPTYVPAQK